VTLGTSCGVVAVAYFYLVAINPNNYIWMSMYETFPQIICLSSTTVNEEFFWISTPIIIYNMSDFKIIPFINSWKLGCGTVNWRTNL